MAVVTWPLSSGEARGRVGDLIYNTWRGRSYVKAFALHQGEFTPAQIEARSFTGMLTIIWQSLDPEPRAAWQHFADKHLLSSWTGQPKRISGYNWFIKLNYWVQNWDGNYLLFPPSQLECYTFQNVTSYWTSPDLSVTWSIQDTAAIKESIVIGRLEGPYQCPRTPNIKRAGPSFPGYENNGSLIFSSLEAGVYYVHLTWVSMRGGISVPVHVEQVCT